MPTIRPRHREVLKKISENMGMPIVQAAKELKYSKSYAESGLLQATDSWQALMQEHIPDELLAKRHKELLNKREVIKEFNDVTGLYDKKVIDEPDTQAVSKGLEMAYRLKRKYPAEGGVNLGILNVIIPKAVAETFGINEKTRPSNPEQGEV